MFIDRLTELASLEAHHRSGRAELFVLYGRRRVGKTELLRHFCTDKPHLFFIATLSSDFEQLASFSQQIWRFTHADAPEGFTFPSWEAAFRALADLPGRPIVVLDEFTYLISGNKAIPSLLQKVWDELLRHTQVFLILCGSYVGMMEREVLSYQAPLYGRRTGSYLLPALDLPAAAAFFPAYTPIQQIEAWAVLGGMPYYLTAFSDQVDIFANIRAHILDSQGTLRREPQLLLMEELREPRNYFSILRAIAEGATRLNEISQAARVGDATTTARYLDILQGLRVVNRRVPATESRPEKSKRGLYQVTDAFLRFWFRYVHPNQGALDLGLADAVLANVYSPPSISSSAMRSRRPRGPTWRAWRRPDNSLSCRSGSAPGGIVRQRWMWQRSAMWTAPCCWGSASGQSTLLGQTCWMTCNARRGSWIRRAAGRRSPMRSSPKQGSRRPWSRGPRLRACGW